jgi:DnaJ-class molecular chaperone
MRKHVKLGISRSDIIEQAFSRARRTLRPVHVDLAAAASYRRRAAQPSEIIRQVPDIEVARRLIAKAREYRIEIMGRCGTCAGQGSVYDSSQGTYVTCRTCGGSGWVD